MGTSIEPRWWAVVDDDEDDRMLCAQALEEGLRMPARFFEDGVDLLDFFGQRGRWAGTDAGRPSIILLDLNMPRLDGRDTLQALKADPSLRGIPVVMLTSSRAERDIASSYDLGAAGFVTKPPGFRALVGVLDGLTRYWRDTVILPAEGGA